MCLADYTQYLLVIISVYIIIPITLSFIIKAILVKLNSETWNLSKVGPLLKWWLPGEADNQKACKTPFQAPQSEVLIPGKLYTGLSVRC